MNYVRNMKLGQDFGDAMFGGKLFCEFFLAHVIEIKNKN